MAVQETAVQAVHLEGGNYFDDMRLDIAQSHGRLAEAPHDARSVRRARWRNLLAFYLTGLALRLRVQEQLVLSGVKRSWFVEFHDYWTRVLGGRPLWTPLEFFLLLHDYRKRQQHAAALTWDGPARHLANWQHPAQIYATLHCVRAAAQQPIVGRALWPMLGRGMRMLEYGCSLAPYWRCYREFFSHLECQWVLADIPSFPFHCAKYLYRHDAEVRFVTIGEADFSDPLPALDGLDVIILTTVLEHLDDPLFVMGYLLRRLKPGGLLVFDYIKSEGTGLDHPRALEQRRSCLELILKETRLVHGVLRDLDGNVGVCIACKTAS